MKPYQTVAGCVLAAALGGSLFAQTQIDLRTQTKSFDFSNANTTKPSKTGTALPATCSVGETFLNTNATPGQNLYACTAANVWTVQGLPSYTAGAYGKLLANDVGGLQWETLGGDLTGDPDSVTVSGLQGRGVSSNAPANGHLLMWNGSQWIPQTPAAAQIANAADVTAANTFAAGARQTFVAGASAPGLRVAPGGLPSAPQTGDVAVDSADSNRAKVFDGTSWVSMGAVPNYFTSFTLATTVTVPGTTHKLGTANLVVECYDNATPANLVEPDSVRVNPSTYDVTVAFAVPQTGRLVINAAGAGGSSGAEASAQIDFPSIAAGSCAPEQTFALPGVVPGDEIAPGWPGGLETGLVGMMRVPSVNTVAVRICNLSGVAVDPASATFRARAVRNF